MPPTIRTTGPLHLEDLEPHRFEDLIRQLSYDFRPWISIEPTGRTGTDDGYDARAFERVDVQEEHEEEEDAGPPRSRVWLIQCKREKQVAPKKLGDYLDDLPQSEDEPIYGIIFAAAADFSKKARDLFRDKTRELGFSEAYLWGKGEIEDQLFQPKNDHLLFAYCGFSLQVRKRSLKTELRALLTTKKRAQKIFEPGRSVLIRDASEKRYPYLDKDETLSREQRGYWKIFERGECKHDGVHLYWRRKFAFFDKDNVHWDLSDNMNDALPHQMMDPWSDEETSEKIRSGRQAAMDIWNAFSDEEKAWYEAHLVLPYENILAFDEDGDDIYNGAHVFTTQWMFQPPHRSAYTHQLYTSSQQHQTRYCSLDNRNRVKKFARASEEG